MSDSGDYDFILRFIVIGNSGAGKSCLLHRFCERKFKQNSTHTIGVEFGTRMIELRGKNVRLQIWDTAGTERYRSVTKNYYRGAVGVLLVYDISSRDTYNALQSWLADARALANENCAMCVVGNKCDLKDQREISFSEASRFAQENGLLFLETSAATGDGVDDVFAQCARKALANIENGALLVNDGKSDASKSVPKPARGRSQESSRDESVDRGGLVSGERIFDHRTDKQPSTCRC